MPLHRTAALAFLVLLGLAACDALAPDPRGSVRIVASRYSLGTPGDTLWLSAEVRNERGRMVPHPSVSWMSLAPGTATVDSTGLLTAQGPGVAEVVAESDGMKGSLRFPVFATGCVVAGVLAFPDTVAGALAEADCRPDEGWVADEWQLDPPHGGDVVVTVESTESSLRLELLDRYGRGLMAGADGIGYRRLLWTAQADDAPYRIRVRDSQAGAVYRLAATEGPPPEWSCLPTGSLALPDTATGALDGADCSGAGHHMDSWSVRLDSSSHVAAMVTVAAGVPVVALLDASGDVLGLAAAEDGRTARLSSSREYPAGDYEIVVAVPEASAGAEYTLVVGRPADVTCDPVGLLVPGETVSGTLQAGACATLVPGVLSAPNDTYRLTVPDSQTLEFTVFSTDFLPGLYVLQDDVLRYRSWPWWYAAVHDWELPAGEYHVMVGTTTSTVGDYVLSIGPAGQMPSCESIGALAPGDTVTGTVEAGSCTVPPKRHGDLWTVRLTDSSAVAVELLADNLHPYVVLADSSGAVIARDSDERSHSSLRIQASVGPGLYQVWAIGYWPGQEGSYRLLFTATPEGEGS